MGYELSVITIFLSMMAFKVNLVTRTCAEAADTWTSLKSERQLKPVDSPPARCHSWVLDFERLFTDYFVQVPSQTM